MSPRARIVTLPGDGIGPEIMAAASRCSSGWATSSSTSGRSAAPRSTRTAPPLTDEALERLPAADAVLLAAVGGPKWDTTDPDAPRPEQGLLGLRKGLGLFANLRPVRPCPALLDASPLRRERIEGTDLLVVRELTGGIYFGDRGARRRHAPTTPASTRSRRSSGSRGRVQVRAHEGHERRQGQRARDLAPVARGRRRAPRRGPPRVELDHLLVDNAAMQLVSSPRAAST